MQLTSEANNQDLTSEIDFLCDTNTTSYPLADKVRRINAAYEELVGMIINADGTWQFDDTNFTDQPVGTFTLVEGQQDYSFATDYLQIEAIDILDDGSPATFRRIKPIDHEELGDRTPEEVYGLETDGSPKLGFPEAYDIVGDTIRLYPAPTSTSVTLASGGQVWFSRTVDLFTTSDTTQEPGIPSTHHILLAYMASLPYNAIYHPDRVAWLERKIFDMKKSLLEHYSYRERQKRKVMAPKKISYI